MLNLFEDHRPPAGVLLRRRRLVLEQSVDDVALSSGLSSERVAAIENWTVNDSRSTIPLVAEVRAIARALDTSLEAVVHNAAAEGIPAILVGLPPDSPTKLVPSLYYVAPDTLAELDPHLTTPPAAQ